MGSGTTDPVPGCPGPEQRKRLGWGQKMGAGAVSEAGGEAGNKGQGAEAWAFRAQTMGVKESKGWCFLGTGSWPTLHPSWQHLTCFSGNSMNSSVLATSTKCCSTYLCAALSRSLHECVSAKPRMPRQLEGSS